VAVNGTSLWAEYAVVDALTAVAVPSKKNFGIINGQIL
jgi:hypothetical protein